eukprot:TRINITY_DN4186_c0_g1_i7.p1 TRINITY_DN4186_c0_g1~~TRINITY_DN4186_c0_g1_i7.p1  ORF type:complete len:368 (+),score=127.62 TRINITY_DN4186_c0_g1_i7:106-1209(+)
MDYRYFEEMLSEESAPFPSLLSRQNSYLFSPLHRPETLPELYNDFEDFKSPPFHLDSEQKISEDLKKEDLLIEKQTKDATKKSDNVRARQRKSAARAEKEEEEASEDAALTRAERNKKYAKASRERKRRYVESLELQVVSLRHEVEFYKARLKSYEMIEKFKSTLGYEYYEMLGKAHACMREANQPLTNEKLFREKLHNAFDQTVKEQANALKAIGDMIVDVALPAHMKVLFWMAEKNLNGMEAPEIVETLSPIVTLEQAQAIVAFRKIIDPEGLKNKMLDGMTVDKSKRIKKLLTKTIQCLKDILTEHKTMADFYRKTDISYCDPYFLEMRAWIDTQLIARPEVRDTELKSLVMGLTFPGDAEGKV